jgi:hypothetical protein
MRALEITAVFLVAMGWQYRKNKPALFVIIATLFADAALLSSRWESISGWGSPFFAVAWLLCMLIAGVLTANKFVLSVRKKKRDEAILTHRPESR